MPSVGLLMYRNRNGTYEVLLVPVADAEGWSIPKDELGPEFGRLNNVLRTFAAQTSVEPRGEILEGRQLAPIELEGAETLHAWAFQGDGQPTEPAAFYSLAEALELVDPASREFIKRLEASLSGSGAPLPEGDGWGQRHNTTEALEWLLAQLHYSAGADPWRDIFLRFLEGVGRVQSRFFVGMLNPYRYNHTIDDDVIALNTIPPTHPTTLKRRLGLAQRETDTPLPAFCDWMALATPKSLTPNVLTGPLTPKHARHFVNERMQQVNQQRLDRNAVCAGELAAKYKQHFNRDYNAFDFDNLDKACVRAANEAWDSRKVGRHLLDSICVARGLVDVIERTVVTGHTRDANVTECGPILDSILNTLTATRIPWLRRSTLRQRVLLQSSKEITGGRQTCRDRILRHFFDQLKDSLGQHKSFRTELDKLSNELVENRTVPFEWNEVARIVDRDAHNVDRWIEGHAEDISVTWFARLLAAVERQLHHVPQLEALVHMVSLVDQVHPAGYEPAIVQVLRILCAPNPVPAGWGRAVQKALERYPIVVEHPFTLGRLRSVLLLCYGCFRARILGPSPALNDKSGVDDIVQCLEQSDNTLMIEILGAGRKRADTEPGHEFKPEEIDRIINVCGNRPLVLRFPSEEFVEVYPEHVFAYWQVFIDVILKQVIPMEVKLAGYEAGIGHLFVQGGPHLPVSEDVLRCVRYLASHSPIRAAVLEPSVLQGHNSVDEIISYLKEAKANELSLQIVEPCISGHEFSETDIQLIFDACRDRPLKLQLPHENVAVDVYRQHLLAYTAVSTCIFLSPAISDEAEGPLDWR